MRKRIGLLTICPEGDYQQRLMKGIFKQCERYNYDVVVITPMVQIANYYKEYVEGELNIYELINFDLLDGVIITPIPMTEDRIETLVDRLQAKFKAECRVPVVSLGLAFGDYPIIETDDTSAFCDITEHLITCHGCRDIAVLTGMEGYPLSYTRLDGVRKAMENHGLTLGKDRIFYGDFWYSGGEILAKKIIDGEVSRPEAVICGSDAMATGLINALLEGGIRVPEDILVTGFDGRPESALNTPGITSYIPDDRRTGALCVNYLHNLLDPDEPELPAEFDRRHNLLVASSCGCPDDIHYVKHRFADSLYVINHDFSHTNISRGIDIGNLMESYNAEIFTNTDTPEHCLQKIYESKYLLQPYGHFYLCLNEDWLDIERNRTEGYPERMHLSVQCDSVSKLHGYGHHVFFGDSNTISFNTKDMLPALSEEFEKPQVFYFVPVHFINVCLGYAVIQSDLDMKTKVGIVFRNYLRNINNSLEMSRSKYRISYMSERDMMTGLLNRRGMDIHLKDKLRSPDPGVSYLCYVIDMDSLKFINDNYGHSVGDTGIRLVSEAAAATAKNGELAVRGGGDEFYILGVGTYTDEDAAAKLQEFKDRLAAGNKAADLPVPITASIGYALRKLDEVPDVQAVLELADVQMYLDKRSKRKVRGRE